jgi:uncharacterized protein (DUF342 family)
MDETGCAAERLDVRVSGDGLSCTLTVLPGPAVSVPSAFEAIAALKGVGVLRSLVDEDALEGLLERAKREPDEPHDEVVARGTPAVDGTNAEFELAPGLAERIEAIRERRRRLEAGELDGRHPEPPRGDIGAGDGPDTAGGAVDHRDYSSFVLVRAGEELGSITRASLGTDGTSVLGATLPSKAGRSLRFAAHRSVEIAPDRVVARIDGVLRVETGRVVVEPTLELTEGVDFATGNIDFPGDVVISGGVKDHFSVTAGGALSISGLVEAARIWCAGDVRIDHGMAGREIGEINVEGDLTAGYLDGVRGTVGGLLVVAREIKECRLHVGRQIVSPRCAIFGGTVSAEQRIDAGTIGSPGGIETVVAVGVGDGVTGMMEQLSEVIGHVRLRKDRAASELKALQARMASLSPTQAERLTELQFEQITGDGLEQRLTDASAQLLDVAGRWSATHVQAHRAVHKGARIRLRHVELTVKQSVVGSVAFDLDDNGEPRCFMNGADQTTPIGSVASVRESADPFAELREVVGDSIADAGPVAGPGPAGDSGIGHEAA